MCFLLIIQQGLPKVVAKRPEMIAYMTHMFVLCLFQPKVHEHPLSVWNKLCYAVGGAPYQITGSALGFFLQIYLLDVAQVTENDSKAAGATLPLHLVKKQPIFYTHTRELALRLNLITMDFFHPLSQSRIR